MRWLIVLDFNKYFTSDQEISLQHIEYKATDDQCTSETVSLRCEDNLTCETVTEDKISFIITRHLNFDPICFFDLTISYKFSLLFNKELKKEINWNGIDFEEEIKDNKDVCLGNLMSRISLQIAQITSSSGQMPIITPPSLCC